MGKRLSNQTTAKADKRSKSDPALASIAIVFQNADHLPERCRALLIDLIPFSLASIADMRSDSQAAVVGMMEETLMVVQSRLDTKVTTQDEQCQSAKAAILKHASKVSEAEVAVNIWKEATIVATSALDVAFKAMIRSQMVLSQKQDIQHLGDEKLARLIDESRAMEDAFLKFLKTRMERSGRPNYDGLKPFLQKLDIEESLLAALPASCAKEMAERGCFDAVVLTEFEKAVSARIVGLRETINVETSASTSREDQVKCAEVEFNGKLEAQKRATDVLDAARKELHEKEIALQEMKTTSEALQLQLELAIRSHANAQEDLQGFEKGPIVDFLTFKSNIALPSQVALAGA